jgi:hypothetical protein
MRRADALAASFDLCKYHIPSSRQSLSTQSICRDCAMPRRPAYTRLATAEEWQKLAEELEAAQQQSWKFWKRPAPGVAPKHQPGSKIKRKG